MWLGGRLPPLARAMREYARLDSGVREAGGHASCSDALERAERRVLSRRGLLRAGGAFGVSAALAACTAPSFRRVARRRAARDRVRVLPRPMARVSSWSGPAWRAPPRPIGWR